MSARSAAAPRNAGILAAQQWPTNAALIADVHRLGYITDDDLVVDVTYGRGGFWHQYRPANLVAHDLRLDGVDFRQLPEADGSVDVVVFDPPYVPQGGRTTSTVDDFIDRYGLVDDAPSTHDKLFELIAAGLAEARRIVRPEGYVLVKCQTFKHGERLHDMPAAIKRRGERIGLRLEDQLTMVRTPGPTNRTSFVAARRNTSELLVLQLRPRSRALSLSDIEAAGYEAR